jgi:signal transduction histidine kinase
MIRQARIKLTLLYSIIFLLLFWSLSFGIYSWMNKFFGDRERIHVNQMYQPEPGIEPFTLQEPSSDMIMDELRNILLIIDFILLITIPTLTWFLTGNALGPVQKAQKREQQFITNASHELRTPLSILHAQMEVILKKKRDISEYQQVLQSNKEEVEDLIALVENLLFISREQTNHSSPINETLDITDVTAERIAYFQKKAHKKKLKIFLKPPASELVILGNLQLFKRLLTNLLENAIKYTVKGSITITIKQENSQAVIQVTDTGIGIAKEKQERIFDRFYRADESRSEQGYGLGLAIAKQITDIHHGTITVNSESKKGTTIKILLPLFRQNLGRNLS